MYDNTARLHDPVLMRYASPDPMFGKYPDISPWAHCSANPLNAIDPLGLDSIQLNEDGTFTVLVKTDDDHDIIIGRDGATLQVGKDFMTSTQQFSGVTEDSEKSPSGPLYFTLDLRQIRGNGAGIFEFLANNSSVEWYRIKLTSGLEYIGTSHLPNYESTIGYLVKERPDEIAMIYIFDHNHPGNGTYASDKDKRIALIFLDNKIPVKLRIYTSAGMYVPPKDFKTPGPINPHYRQYFPNR